MNSKHHAAIAALVAFVASSAVALYAVPRVMTRQPVVAADSAKVRPNSWGDMAQREVDALTLELGKLPKATVSIFCSDAACADLALDFDNAFESARWVSGIEHPIADTNRGLNVAPDNAAGRALAAAIERATKGRLRPGLVAADIGDRLAVIISRKGN